MKIGRHVGRCVVAVIALGQPAAAQSPDPCPIPLARAIGTAPNIFSEEREAELGDVVAEQIEQNFNVIHDAKLSEFLQRTGARVVAALPPTRLQIRFSIADLPEANAYTLPGGRVYVSRKLIAILHSEDELAGILAHETGHILAHHSAIEVSRQLKEVLGITKVGDRSEVVAAYNRLVENAARKPDVMNGDRGHEGDDQDAADLIGLFAMAKAGYDVRAYAAAFDRVVETRGKTGSFFGNLFGRTKPEERRLRTILKAIDELPAGCRGASQASSGEAFLAWQSAVVKHTASARDESIRGLRSRTMLDPGLRPEVSRLRFSPDGRYVLAQDESGIVVLSREPFAVLFRIEAFDVSPASFTPDSSAIAFARSDLRVEVWDVKSAAIRSAHELTATTGCLQFQLSPDAATLAVLTAEFGLRLVDVGTGQVIFEKKKFALPTEFDLFVMLLQQLAGFDDGRPSIEWVQMGFSPSGRIFASAASRRVGGAIIAELDDPRAVAVDVKSRQPIVLPKPMVEALSGGFVFATDDRVVASNPVNQLLSGVIAFPGGGLIDRVPLGGASLELTTAGQHVMIRPIKDYAVGLMDLSSKKIYLANKEPAFDVYASIFVSEKMDGEVGLYGVAMQRQMTGVTLPASLLGRPRSVTVSPDLRWLAVSNSKRGAVWDLTTGKRTFFVRSFRGGWFGPDGSFLAEFERDGKEGRVVMRLDLEKRTSADNTGIDDRFTRQVGRLLVTRAPAKVGESIARNSTIDVKAVTGASLWSRQFPKETPGLIVDDEGGAVVFSWSGTAEAVADLAKSDSALAAKIKGRKKREAGQDIVLEVVDAQTGKVRGRVLVETGLGSFEIETVRSVGDLLAVTDDQNRVLVYRLSTGEQIGKVFGSRMAIDESCSAIAVENEPGRVAVYDAATMTKRDEMRFPERVVHLRLSAGGRTLFALTAAQVAYVVDLGAEGVIEPERPSAAVSP